MAQIGFIPATRRPDGRRCRARDDGRAEHPHRHAVDLLARRAFRRRRRRPHAGAGGERVGRQGRRRPSRSLRPVRRPATARSILDLPDPVDPDRVFATLRRPHYDLAGFPPPRLLPALLRIADPGRILYGSDWPFTPVPVVTRLAGEIDATTLFGDTTRRRVLQDNALALFPRLRG